MTSKISEKSLSPVTKLTFVLKPSVFVPGQGSVIKYLHRCLTKRHPGTSKTKCESYANMDVRSRQHSERQVPEQGAEGTLT